MTTNNNISQATFSCPSLDPDFFTVQDSFPKAYSFSTPEDLAATREHINFSIETTLHGHQDTICYSNLNIPSPAGPLRATIFQSKSHRQSSANAPGILHIHSGGHCQGSRFVGAGLVLDWVESLGAVCLTAEYRLAPEHPQPAQVEDSFATLKWFSAHAAELGFNPQKLIVTGNSAGGNLAAGVTLLARDRDGPEILGQVLTYPWLDDSNETLSMQQFGGLLPWSKIHSIDACDFALGKNREHADIYTVPGRATDLGGLPDTFIDVGSADVFRDEDFQFATKLWACGVSADLHVWPGCWHGFDIFVPDAPASRKAAKARLKWLQKLLAKE
ncbi:alpha/beta-hydrolase [Aspergillus sclerotioniger CBS 115572]|uniref:Alpha/beta-hydrolase n=1 Tax=Aspergillus sclerotioniger CBS 115572 TaxID=1450535 RepID=A0A317WQY6_9EURO|nr:alpha/beta-hydrolase [Aspergillus sclerotioniger CBS 115572]PWY86580.1 alpha/beta-hydrolase [Aspergillus sclerotioniger CBS 115572]